MLADGNTTELRTIEEAYQWSALASSLRVDGDDTIKTPGDMTAAAGMNNHRTGLAFLRLRSEWGSSARPAPPTPESIEALAASYAVEGPSTRVKVSMTKEQIARATTDAGLDPAKVQALKWLASIEVPNVHQGKVRVEADGEATFHLPLRLAHRQAWDWHIHEQGLLLMRLKTLPTVRDAILARSRMENWGCDEHTVAKVLLWWLDPRCEKCGGRNDVVKLRGKDVGKVCKPCKGTGLERQGEPPHGARGKKIAQHIRDCISDAKRELKEGAYRLHRTKAGKEHRGEA